MFSTLRTRFGIPGVISVIALVFAMFGGAYAASNSSGGGKATASAKAKKGPRGPKGATGPAGPAGAQGPAGPAGAKGDAGANGSNGGAGPTGPTGAAGAKGATGAAGATGATGFSGFTETLPAGKTETGTWSFSIPSNTHFVETYNPISFSIPLASAELGAQKAFFFDWEKVENGEFGSSGCHWEREGGGAAPEATVPGTLCIFEQYGEQEDVENISVVPAGEPAQPGFGAAGAFLYVKTKSGGTIGSYGFGTWAVTAPTAP
jgi:hypothetical protein